MSGLSLYGVPIEQWISVLTLIYIAFMLVGAVPKAIHGLKYVMCLALPRKALVWAHVVKDNSEIDKIINKAGE